MAEGQTSIQQSVQTLPQGLQPLAHYLQQIITLDKQNRREDNRQNKGQLNAAVNINLQQETAVRQDCRQEGRTHERQSNRQRQLPDTLPADRQQAMLVRRIFIPNIEDYAHGKHREHACRRQSQQLTRKQAAADKQQRQTACTQYCPQQQLLAAAEIKQQRQIQHHTGNDSQKHRNKAQLRGEIRRKAIALRRKDACLANRIATRFNAGLNIADIFQIRLHNILSTLRHEEGTDIVYADIALLVRQRPTAQSLAHTDFLLLSRVDNIGACSLVVVELCQRQQAVNLGKL